MTPEKINDMAFDKYLQFVSDYGTMFQGYIITDFYMLRDEVLKNHSRKITFDSNKGLFRTYLDNSIQITSKTLEGLEDKIFIYYLDHNIGVYSFPQVLCRSIAFNRDHDFLSQSSVDRYLVDYRKYLRESVIFNQDIRCITETDLTLFFNDLMSQKPTSKVVSNVKTVIRLAFNYARIQEGIECLQINFFFSNLQYSKRAFSSKKVTENRVFSMDYKAALFDVLTDNPLDLGIRLDFNTGLRVGELCALQVVDFSAEKGLLYVRRSEEVSGVGKNRVYSDSSPKCYKERAVILNESAYDICFELCNGSDYFFPYKDGHYHKCAFDSRLRLLCKKAGIPSFSFHDIRRTYASYLLDHDGVSEKFVQEQLGHSDIRTTQQYYYYTTKRLEDYRKMANYVK